MHIMKNEDNGVITMYLHGRPNLLSIFSKWVDSYFSKKGEGYLDWRKEYLKGLGINVDLMGYDYEGDWDDEDYYESMGDWYNSHLNDDSYWNPSPSEDDDYDDYDEVYPGNFFTKPSSTKRRGKNGKYKHEKSKGCRIVDMNGKPYCSDKGKKGKYSKGSKGSEDYSFEDSCYNGAKEIYYYDDYMDRLNFIKFKNIPSFEAFCSLKGITIPKDVLKMMMYRPVSHCCINKNLLLEEKELLLEAEESYGSMVYSAATSEDIDDLGNSLDL